MQVGDSTEGARVARRRGPGDRLRKQSQSRAGAAGRASDSIAERQNSPWSIQLLAAQRQLYSEAKRWRRLGAWSVTAAAIVGVAATLVAPELLKLIGPMGGVVGLAQWLASLVEKQFVKTAANMQEQFDDSVYQLPWNPVLGTKCDPEDVIAAAARHNGDRTKLADWYTLPYGVPYPLDILLCQRTNLRWDSVLRRSYAKLVIAVLSALFLAAAAGGVIHGLSLGELLFALLPLTGALRLGIETVRGQYKHADDQGDLKELVEATWDRARLKPHSISPSDLRSIQDEIFRLRTVAPPVPDGFYWKKRDEMEHEAKAAIARLWDEARLSRHEFVRTSGSNGPVRLVP